MIKLSAKKTFAIIAMVIAVNTISLVGFAATPSSGEKQVKSKQAIDITATAYAPGPHDNGKWGNLTHIGTQVRPGVIAVDPRLIPLGSKLYIEFSNGEGMYGVAEDTGGAIKDKRIDIAMNTVAEANQFGIQKVKVYIIE